MKSLEYGIIGNGNTTALVGGDSSIDWLCLPKFDSPSVFAKILDSGKGGFFKVLPRRKCQTDHEYVKDSNVLVTHFTCKEWAFDLIDYFPHHEEGGKLYKEEELHRFIKVVRGRPSIRIEIEPRFNYAAEIPSKELAKDCIIFSSASKMDKLYLYSNLALDSLFHGKYVELNGDSYLVITYNKIKPIEGVEAIRSQMRRTIDYWQNWIEKATLPKRHRDLVARSALVLRLLTYEDTGAIVAAATTSIPEIIGGVRNWDYRYCWIRDASLTVMALTTLSRFDVAEEFLSWMLAVHRKYGVNLQVLFGVDEKRNIQERTLDYLKGYKGSKPVRVGNAAATQRQVDIFGELLDAIYLLYTKLGGKMTLDEADWELVYTLVESAVEEWRYKDHSIWEFRTLSKHYTFSKVLCWVALDRGAKLAAAYKKKKYAARWAKIAGEIKREILRRGWNSKLHAFTQSYGSEELDASMLLLPYFGFISYRDKRMVSTVEAVGRYLFDGKFIMRYNADDDFGKQESAFIICTFWYIDALHHIGKKKEAINLFNRMVSYANSLGLMSEAINPKTGELLGNFPQAYSHIALINTVEHLFGSRKRGRST